MEGCTHSPPCFAEVLWVCLKASVAFLFPSTDFCLALQEVCKILEGLLLLFSLSGTSGSTLCIHILPGRVYFCCGLYQFNSNCYALSLSAPSYMPFPPRCFPVTLWLTKCSKRVSLPPFLISSPTSLITVSSYYLGLETCC